MTSCDFTLFYSFFSQANVCYWDVLGKEYYIANLCLIMIDFNAVDFSERRFEVVISFVWRLVYTGCPKKGGTADFQYLAS